VFAVASLCVSSCNWLGISHPISNDGSCSGQLTNCQNSGSCVGSATNPCRTVGSDILNLAADSESLAVGEVSGITATYGGMTLTGQSGLAVANSDSGVVWTLNGLQAMALAVGTSTVSETYDGSNAAITFAVHPALNGASAAVFMNIALGTDATSWLPASTVVHAGWVVQFDPYIEHNVTFDPVPGAPMDIAVGTSIATRLFSTAGSFPYHCTIHGESGVVTVLSP
jgi:plastocyanin